jgi:hypothetical protein
MRSGVTWSQQAYIKASNTSAQALFGTSVAVLGDEAVVGSYQENSNATGVDGSQNNQLAANSGAAYAFSRSGVTWSQQAYLKASNTHINDNFGSSVAIDAGTVVVGAPGESSNAIGLNGDGSNHSAQFSGAAYVFVSFSNANNQPSILAVDQTVQQGSASANLEIATVHDVEDAANTLAVTVNGGSSATVNGVTVSGINVNAMGVVTADCLQDDGTGDFLQWNSMTGDYLFTHCGTNGFTLAGTGSARLANNTQSLSDNKPDRRISAGYLVNQLTGSATVIVIRAAGLTQTYHINQTNIHPTCVCRGG